jgi:hypothetical protein
MGNLVGICYFVWQRNRLVIWIEEEMREIRNLTAEELQEKIDRTNQDLKKLQTEPSQTRQIEILIEYRDYLVSELKGFEK